MPIINVHCKRQDFRRAGRAWNKGDNPVNTDEHSQDELDAMLAALDADPMFTVTLEGDSEATATFTPGGKQPQRNLIDRLVDAISQLDPANPDHFTKSGKPEIKALEAAAGVNLDGRLRDQAWKRSKQG